MLFTVFLCHQKYDYLFTFNLTDGYIFDLKRRHNVLIQLYFAKKVKKKTTVRLRNE